MPPPSDSVVLGISVAKSHVNNVVFGILTTKNHANYVVFGTLTAKNHVNNVVFGILAANNHANYVVFGTLTANNHANYVVFGIPAATNHANTVVWGTSTSQAMQISWFGAPRHPPGASCGSWGFLGGSLVLPGLPPAASWDLLGALWASWEAPAPDNRLLDLGPQVWGPAAVVKPLRYVLQ